jgi:site-specific recombinase XerD
MALKLYRRHRKECEGSHPEDARTGEFEEGRRGWKKCGCLIHVSGTLGGKFNRRQTGKADWDEAKAVASLWEKSGSWDGQDKIEEPVSLPTATASSDPVRVTVARAISAFTAEFEEYAAQATRKKYKRLLRRLQSFSDARGYAAVDQWTTLDVREFRSSWPVSPRTAARIMSMVKNFFEFCRENKWTTDNPARMVRNPRGRDTSDLRHEQKLPFTDAELTRMYAAAETKYGTHEVKRSSGTGDRRKEITYTRDNKWSGQDVADFISVSVYTGLRISDVCLFHIDRMQQDGAIRLRTTKAGTHVCTWVPEWLQERIRERALTVGPHIFGEHRTKTLDVITEVWRRKLKKLWSLCGPWSEAPTPHRFRHTFARILLERPGVTVRDVAELLGNTEDMVRKHYAAWIPERQERLTAVLKAAFETKPKPNVIAMPKKPASR